MAKDLHFPLFFSVSTISVFAPFISRTIHFRCSGLRDHKIFIGLVKYNFMGGLGTIIVVLDTCNFTDSYFSRQVTLSFQTSII